MQFYAITSNLYSNMHNTLAKKIPLANEQISLFILSVLFSKRLTNNNSLPFLAFFINTIIITKENLLYKKSL